MVEDAAASSARRNCWRNRSAARNLVVQIDDIKVLRVSSSNETPVTPVTIDLPIDVDVPNSEFPVVLYRKAADANDLEDHFRLQFWAHHWGGMWTDGIFGYHHYHSNAHEVMGVIDGEADLMLGGVEGRKLTIRRGDVLILPAGTGHRRLKASPEFRVVGAYPVGQEGYDIYTPSLDFANARGRLRAVPLPGQDPLYGPTGALLDIWKDRSDREI